MDKPITYTTPHLECCTDPKCASGLRNNYFLGKRLTPEMFRIEQQYLVERRRLLNRAIHGWGVVYGYAITADSPSKETGQRRLKVGAGLALDECGRELLQVGELSLKLQDVIIIDKEGHRLDPQKAFDRTQQAGYKPGSVAEPICWLLSAHYAEQDREPVPVTNPCHCDRHEWEHICETVRYTLQEIPCTKCCENFSCELTCECGKGPCCEDLTEATEHGEDREKSSTKEMAFKRGGCRCLCDHLTNLNVATKCGPLCEIKEPCGLVRVDLHNGVPLACVNVVRDDCNEWTFGKWIEPCGPRRLVKRNDLLFDLIRGCDLTRIVKIGWEEWHRWEAPVKFEDFAGAFGTIGNNQAEYVTNFTIEFSRPVRKRTLLPDCFAMRILSVEQQSGWWQVYRVPIVRIETASHGDDPPDYARKAGIVVGGAWCEDEIGRMGRTSLFQCGDTRVEIEVRGDFIIDCNGQPVDANAAGLCPYPTGNGTPGGTFLSTFLVTPARRILTGNVPNDPGNPQQGVSL